ncbi:hypothetical protein D3C75_730520 [compost metagenome]
MGSQRANGAYWPRDRYWRRLPGRARRQRIFPGDGHRHAYFRRTDFEKENLRAGAVRRGIYRLDYLGNQ